jgi:hypothetical protein
MINVCIRPQPAVAGEPAIAATAAGETSSDEILVERIAAGNNLAMQALFARHRTSVYRWLLRLVSNETLAEGSHCGWCRSARRAHWASAPGSAGSGMQPTQVRVMRQPPGRGYSSRKRWKG